MRVLVGVAAVLLLATALIDVAAALRATSEHDYEHELGTVEPPRIARRAAQ